MNSRTSRREVLVGLVIVVGLGGLLGLLVLAGGGPGFLTARRTIDVIFRDGQGIRDGSPVRIAGHRRRPGRRHRPDRVRRSPPRPGPDLAADAASARSCSRTSRSRSSRA